MVRQATLLQLVVVLILRVSSSIYVVPTDAALSNPDRMNYSDILKTSPAYHIKEFLSTTFHKATLIVTPRVDRGSTFHFRTGRCTRFSCFSLSFPPRPLSLSSSCLLSKTFTGFFYNSTSFCIRQRLSARGKEGRGGGGGRRQNFPNSR